ncbi:MAG TPA: ABC transporter ATP-binding protein [Candidatus Dormibacteraeota bacterium]|nr:ABC transporter ATP-binding protein [Candidatus Dormibacteraeota bacterium]
MSSPAGAPRSLTRPQPEPWPAEGDGCLLRIRGLTVTYGLRSRHPVRAVAGVSLDVGRGRTLALIGESGSGKSSVARAICGLGPVESGSIEMDGHELTAAADRPAAAGERGIQIVFQDPVSALDPRWPAWRSVAEPLVRDVPSPGDRRERAIALLERVGLDPSFGDRHPHQLSGGQRQRVTIARALAPGPKLVILDEAVSALDVSVRNEILVLLDDLKRQGGLTYLLISHDMGAVAQMATEIAVMYLGRVVESGEARQVILHPVHPYTDALLASVPTVSGDVVEPSFRPRGEIGDTAHPPPGCRFHPRCPLAVDVCTTEEPAMRTVRGRLAACHRAEETDRLRRVGGQPE